MAISPSPVALDCLSFKGVYGFTLCHLSMVHPCLQHRDRRLVMGALVQNAAPQRFVHSKWLGSSPVCSFGFFSESKTLFLGYSSCFAHASACTPNSQLQSTQITEIASKPLSAMAEEGEEMLDFVINLSCEIVWEIIRFDYE